MVAPQDSPRSRPHPGQQWEESSAKFHLSDVFTTLSIIPIITIPHEGDLSMMFGRAEGGMGTEGWGLPFLSVLSQTRELPDNYHFLVIGTTHRLICWSEFTYLEYWYTYSLKLNISLDARYSTIMSMNVQSLCMMRHEWSISWVHLTSVVCVRQDLIKRHNASNWFYIQLFSIYRWSQCIMSLPLKVRSNECYNYHCQIWTEFYYCCYRELVEMIKWAICRASIVKP